MNWSRPVIENDTRNRPSCCLLRRDRASPEAQGADRLNLLGLARGVTEIAQLLFLIAGWTVLPGSPVRWRWLDTT